METLVQQQYHSEDWKPHWLRLRHLLVPAIELQDLYALEDIENGIENGQFQLWPASESIMITEVVTYPQKRIMNLLFCGGDVEELLAMLPEFERFATFFWVFSSLWRWENWLAKIFKKTWVCGRTHD